MLRKIIATLFFTAALIFAFIFFLLNGIKIKSFSLGQIYISQLYIKLDKKLIVDIDQIKLINDSKVESSYEDLITNIKRIPIMLKFFKRIDIESLLIDGNQFKILFDNDLLYLDNKFVNLSSKYNKHDNTVSLDLYSLYLKDINLLLRGSVNLDYEGQIASFYGNYLLQEKIAGELNTQINESFADFFVTTKEIDNLKFLKKLFRLDKEAEAWMYDNVTGKMQLNFLYGKLNMQTFEPMLDSIKGEAVIKNANIHFNRKVAPVKTNKLTITYENDTLKFDLNKPTYKGLSIDGSKVEISNLTVEEKGRVDVLIQTKALLNDEILAITKAYDLNIPVKQIKGKTDAHVLLKIPYVGAMQTFGNFFLKESDLLINDVFPFYSKRANVELNQDKVIIKASHFKIDKLLDSTVDLTIDLNQLNAKGLANIKEFEIKNNENEVIILNGLKTPISLDFQTDTLINIQKIKTKIVLNKDTNDVYIDKLQTIAPYSKLLQENNLTKGELKLSIVDENNISFAGRVEALELPIKRGNKAVDTIAFEGLYKNEELSLHSLQKDILLEVKKNQPLFITLKNLHVFPQSQSENAKDVNLDVRMLNTQVHIDEDIYYPKDVLVSLDNGNITFNGVLDKLDLPILKNGNKVTTLDLDGKVQESLIELQSKDKAFYFSLRDENNYFIKLKGLDLAYDTKATTDGDKNVHVIGENSKIIINEQYVVLAKKFDFRMDDKITRFELEHNKTTMSYLKDEKGVSTVTAKNVSDKFINAFFQKDFVKGGILSIEATGKDDITAGRINFKQNTIKNLRTLNNVIMLVNTSPAIVNPFLAIPSVFGMVTSGGFNVNGYKVNKGYVDFTYNEQKKFLNMYTINTIGNSVDFDGFATFDFEKDLVHSDIKLIFMKGYSSAINAIPGLDYIILGDDKQISTMVNIRGKIGEPKIKTNVLQDSAKGPIDVLKRIFTLPLKPFLD